jgi:hypothetical protein
MNELERPARITAGKQRMDAFPWSWQDDYSGRIYVPVEDGDRWAWMIDQYRQNLHGKLVLASGYGHSLNECVTAIERWLRNNARAEQMLLDL